MAAGWPAASSNALERALRAWSRQDPVAKLGEERCAKAIETGAGRSSRTDLRAQRHVPGAHSRVHNSTLGFVQLSAEDLPELLVPGLRAKAAIPKAQRSSPAVSDMKDCDELHVEAHNCGPRRATRRSPPCRSRRAMIAGLSGSLLSHEALERRIPEILGGQLGESECRVVHARMRAWHVPLRAQIGPAASARTCFDRLGAPLFAQLGYRVLPAPGAEGTLQGLAAGGWQSGCHARRHRLGSGRVARLARRRALRDRQ